MSSQSSYHEPSNSSLSLHRFEPSSHHGPLNGHEPPNEHQRSSFSARPVDRKEYIENPLRLHERPDVINDAKGFHKNENLSAVVRLDTFQRGALLGRFGTWEDAEDREHQYSRTEKDSLKDEASQQLWAQLRQLRKDMLVVLGTCAVGAVLQGWTQESIVGANLKWPTELKHANGGSEEAARIRFALVNSMPWFAASVIGVWVIDPISAAFGRRGALLFAAICSLGGPIGAYFSQSWAQLLACRCIQGVGMGAKASVIPVLESEMVPKGLRGHLLVIWQTFVAVGTMMGASTNLIFRGRWRDQIGISFVAAVPLLFLCYIIPESPRWLIKKRKYLKAYRALEGLTTTPVQACRDLYLIDRQLDVEMALRANNDPTEKDVKAAVFTKAPPERNSLWTFFKRLRELFQFQRNRRALWGAASVMISQQFSGINIFAFVATSLFSTQDQDHLQSLWIKFGFTVLNSIFSASAFFLIKTVGRRSLILSSMMGMLPLLVLTGYFLDKAALEGDTAAVSEPNEAYTQLNRATPSVITLLYFYTAVYSPGAGVIPFMYSSEVFAQHYREVGMSVAVAINFLFAGVLAMAVPYIIRGGFKDYLNLMGIFASLTAVGTVLIWIYMRSPTHSASLEEINFMFDRPTRDYFLYQLQEATPKTIVRLWPLGKRPTKQSFEQWCKQGAGNKKRSRVEDGEELGNTTARESRPQGLH